ncbi:MAG TPA: nucleoside/nucleotide kinase family protein [Nocardia sp.]|uniref:nucleoside/nucleotide kinase family protein n=1 Tax=Nocardia sp. TaxID=1821 RepID=UPI002B4B5497|nr:nucleoside/nucleotide kinase family protein [Nocardia sp.]HLS78190.1 nucleoside/nucleotide kinase family protein [Nocardia sp.]
MRGRARKVSVAELAAAVRERAAGAGGRYLLGIAGPPGAGKSTLAHTLCAALNDGDTLAGVAPMDGYHLSNARLDELGRRAGKGEPDTFDSAGFAGNLARLRAAPVGEAVEWPTFDRALDEPTPAGTVFTGERIVITEGNYLLMDDPVLGAWHRVRGLLDECWYLDAERETLATRLTRRHRDGGRSEAAAREKVELSDLRNAELVARTRGRADLALRAEGDGYVVSES